MDLLCMIYMYLVCCILNIYDCTNILEEDVGKSVEKIDEQRRKTLAYEYLCYLEGAKK